MLCHSAYYTSYPRFASKRKRMERGVLCFLSRLNVVATGPCTTMEFELALRSICSASWVDFTYSWNFHQRRLMMVIHSHQKWDVHYRFYKGFASPMRRAGSSVRLRVPSLCSWPLWKPSTVSPMIHHVLWGCLSHIPLIPLCAFSSMHQQMCAARLNMRMVCRLCAVSWMHVLRPVQMLPIWTQRAPNVLSFFCSICRPKNSSSRRASNCLAVQRNPYFDLLKHLSPSVAMRVPGRLSQLPRSTHLLLPLGPDSNVSCPMDHQQNMWPKAS